MNVDFQNRCLQWGKDKTASGTGRVVSLSITAMNCLPEWEASFPDRKPKHFVFPYEHYGASGHKFGKGSGVAAAVSYGTDPTKPMGNTKTAWKEALSRAAVMLTEDGGVVEPLKLRMHDLRHTAYTSMRNANIPLDKIAKILGWSPSQMVRMAWIYGHFSVEDLREEAEQIPGAPL